MSLIPDAADKTTLNLPKFFHTWFLSQIQVVGQFEILGDISS